MRRRGAIAGVLSLVSVLALVAAAAAGERQISVFADDDMLVYARPARVDRSMAELQRLGVDVVRLPALWRNLAGSRRPAEASGPAAYRLGPLHELDRSILSARAHGLAVMLNVRGGAPDWALPAHIPGRLREDHSYKPRAAAYGAFVKMLGNRYSGGYVTGAGDQLPRVGIWTLWNEPNWRSLLQPQSVRDPRTGHRHPFSPQLYRSLYRAGTAALDATGHISDQILLGETAPLGDAGLGARRTLYAARFYRQLFCLNRQLDPLRGRQARLAGCGDFRRGPLQANGVAHHPYPVVDPPERHSDGRDEIRLADGGRLAAILDAADRHHRITGRVPIWYTEFGYQTRPPDPYRGVPLRRQANWDIRGERLAYRDPRVLSFAQFLMRDAAPRTDLERSDHSYWGTYQTGLRFRDGRRKPAYDAYRLPLLALDPIRSGRPLRLWGMVRPGVDGVAQTIRLQHRSGRRGRWSPVGNRTVRNPKGYFTVRLRFARAGQYRFVWRGPQGDVASRPAARR